MQDNPGPYGSQDEEEQEAKKNSESANSETLDQEKILRDELRAAIQTYMLVWRAGLTALPTLLVAIGFLRKDYLELQATNYGAPKPVPSQVPVDLAWACRKLWFCDVGSSPIDRGLLSIPLYQYLLGTLLLAGVAYLFYRLQRSVGVRTTFFMIQLVAAHSAKMPPFSTSDRPVWQFALFAFPAFDIGIRILLWTDACFGAHAMLFSTDHLPVLMLELCLTAFFAAWMVGEQLVHDAWRERVGVSWVPTPQEKHPGPLRALVDHLHPGHVR